MEVFPENTGSIHEPPGFEGSIPKILKSAVRQAKLAKSNTSYAAIVRAERTDRNFGRSAKANQPTSLKPLLELPSIFGTAD